MDSVWKILGLSVLIAMAIYGVLAFIGDIQQANEISQLKKQVEHQTMLIEILEKSCK